MTSVSISRAIWLMGVNLAALAGFFAFSVQAASPGESIFQQKCVACHTIGEGKKIGPDLLGVAQRRDMEWLRGFIQSPSAYFARNDATAAALLKEFGIPMPDLGLTPEEMEAIIGYLSGASPLQAGMTGTLPPQYLWFLLLGFAGALALTGIGFAAGRKKTEVRK